MSIRSIAVPSLVLLLAAGVAGCGPSSAPPPSVAVLNLIEEARNFPAAGDDLTMYIGDRFAEEEQRLARLGADAGPLAPTF